MVCASARAREKFNPNIMATNYFLYNTVHTHTVHGVSELSKLIQIYIHDMASNYSTTPSIQEKKIRVHVKE